MLRKRPGQTLAEYGLLLALIAIIVIVALLFVAPIISSIAGNQEAAEGSVASPPQQIVVNGYTYQLVGPASDE